MPSIYFILRCLPSTLKNTTAPEAAGAEKWVQTTATSVGPGGHRQDTGPAVTLPGARGPLQASSSFLDLSWKNAAEVEARQNLCKSVPPGLVT